MADPPRYTDTRDDTGLGSDREPTPRTPRWVKMSGIIVGVLVLLIIAIMLFGGGEHGPSRHTSSSGAVGQAPLPSVSADLTLSGGGLAGHAASAGGH